MLSEKERGKLARRHELDGKLLSCIGIIDELKVLLERISAGSIHPSCAEIHSSADCHCAEYHADKALGLLR